MRGEGGPDGPYTVAIRSAGEPVRRVGLNATGVRRISLPAGFVTDDYERFTSGAKNYTIEEINSRGALEVRYRPGQELLARRTAVGRATVTNFFGRVCADLSVRVKAPNRVTVGKNFYYT